MAKLIPEARLKLIEELLQKHPAGLARDGILQGIAANGSARTLQSHLAYLVSHQRITTKGQGRATRYLPLSDDGTLHVREDQRTIPFSKAGKEICSYVSQPIQRRQTIGYDRSFLDSYRPNETFYLKESDRIRLHAIGTVPSGAAPAGTYARKIFDRLLIDLSWSSSRLEGNSYSLLDTKRLIAFGREAVGKDRIEAQMILNHKDAIEFLVEAAIEIDFNRYTILNLHSLLSNNLLENPLAEGRLRSIEVGIHGSSFMPLALPQLVTECFEQILTTVQEIRDPFEQSFFMMVHLPYLQPFEDVNKRVSRLAANIPFIKANLIPLTFLDVPKDAYTKAILGVYELNRIEALKDIYMWAYETSAKRYAEVRQVLGEPDPFRLQYRDYLREVVGFVIRNKLKRREALELMERWSLENIPANDQPRFLEEAEDAILSLHEGNFARYKVRPSQFDAWKKDWG